MNQKTVILLVVVAGAAAGGYYLYKKQKAAQSVSAPVATNPDQRNNGLPINRVGDLINEGRAVLDEFKKAYGGF